jgi:hypothetical protein
MHLALILVVSTSFKLSATVVDMTGSYLASVSFSQPLILHL